MQNNNRKECSNISTNEKKKKQRSGGKLKFSKEEKREAKEKAQTGKLDHKVNKTEAKADKYDKKRGKYTTNSRQQKSVLRNGISTRKRERRKPASALIRKLYP